MMECRKLGKTGVDVGIIGLGTVYLENVPRETRVSVIRESIDNGMNYIDIVLLTPTQRDDIGIALEGRREKVMLAGMRNDRPITVKKMVIRV